MMVGPLPARARLVIAAGAMLLAAICADRLAAQAPVKGPYVVADVASGAVIEHHDAVRAWYPASTTKLMTAYVTFRAVRNGEMGLDSPVTMSAKAHGQPPTRMAFRPGTVLTVDNALKIILARSSNDVAMALAEAVAGSEDAFAARMNAEARRLGMSRSHFVNPHGLPDSRQVTTARDMALLARALLVEFPEHRAYLAIPAIQLGNEVMRNHNTLVERYPGATGMKTGFICSSGFNLVASARRGGRELIAVVFGAYNAAHRAERAAELLDAGFRPRGPFARSRVTLANVSSGAAFDTPLDMRPEICTERRQEVLAMLYPEARPQFGMRPDGTIVVRQAARAPRSRLVEPKALAPPVRVYLGGATEVARLSAPPLPRARPTPPAQLLAQSGIAGEAEVESPAPAGAEPAIQTAAPTGTSPTQARIEAAFASMAETHDAGEAPAPALAFASALAANAPEPASEAQEAIRSLAIPLPRPRPEPGL